MSVFLLGVCCFVLRSPLLTAAFSFTVAGVPPTPNPLQRKPAGPSAQGQDPTVSHFESVLRSNSDGTRREDVVIPPPSLGGLCTEEEEKVKNTTRRLRTRGARR